MKQVVEHPIIGNITINIRKGLRSVTYRVSTKGVSISTPPEMAHKLFPLSTQRIEWIQNAQTQMESRKVTLLITPEHPLQTLTFRVAFEPRKAQKPRFTARFQESTLTIGYFEQLDLNLQPQQQVVHRIVKLYLKREAEQYLPKRLQQLASTLGYRFSDVKINSARGRWGSCTSKGSINLSCSLMMPPSEFIDYFLAHALCSTQYMTPADPFNKLITPPFPLFCALATPPPIQVVRLVALPPYLPPYFSLFLISTLIGT